MKVFVTGPDGLLGSNLIRELIYRKHEVRAFILPGRSFKSLDGLEIERYFGDILNPEDLANGVSGCDAVIHAAADTSIWPGRSARVRAINVEGTKNMIEAAIAAKVNRFVHIGSGSSFGFGPRESPGTESTPFTGHKFGLDYIDSKYEGQQLVLKAARERGLPALAICPTFMIGPFDSKPGSGAIILAIHQKKLPAYTGGGRNFVYVKDVAVATANALTMGRIGECYIAGNENLSYKEINTIIAEEVGAPAPKFRAPDLPIRFWGMLSSLAGKTLNKPPTLSYPLARIACISQYLSSKKAVGELEMPQTDIRIAIRDAFGWFKQNGYC